MAKAKAKPPAKTGWHGLPMGDGVKRVLSVAYRARRPALLEGPTGIGKSELIRETADGLGVEHVVIDLSLLEPPDLVGLPRIDDGVTRYARPAILPAGGAGILLLEELNRAERYIQQPALQLLTGRRLHEYELPAGWVAFAAINPETDEYQVTPLDPALRARFLNLRVRADRDGWLAWADRHHVHPAVVEVAKSHEAVFDDTPPRTWTYVSHLLQELTPAELRDEPLLRAALGGYLPASWVETALDALDRHSAGDEVPVGPLLTRYHTDAAVRRQVAGPRDGGATDVLEQIAYRLLRLAEGPELAQLVQRGQFDLAAFEALLGDLPGDHRELIQEAFADNPAADKLIKVDGKHALHGYADSPLQQQLRAWSSDPLRRHRVGPAVRGVCRHLERHPDPAGLKRNRETAACLGKLIADVGDAAGPLRETCRRLGVGPKS